VWTSLTRAAIGVLAAGAKAFLSAQPLLAPVRDGFLVLARRRACSGRPRSGGGAASAAQAATEAAGKQYRRRWVLYMYADKAAFLADCRAWEAEERQRKEQVKERECAQQQIRDRGRPARKRSERSRGPNDNAQRVQRRRAANPRLLPPEVVQAFADLGDGDCSTILVRGQGAHPRCICGWAPSTSVVVRFPECWSR